MSETVESPSTPATEIIEQPSIFAHLVPGNPAAKLAFSLVVDRTIQDPNWIPYARRFICYEPVREETSSSYSETDGSETDSNRVHVRWQGWYVLDFDQLPSNPHRGWRLGSGRLRTGQEDVEFLLTSRPRRDGVNAQHCRLNFNFDSYVLLITAEINRQVLVLANGTTVLRGTSMATPSKSTSIELGNLRFELSFTDMHQSVYRSYIREIREVFGTDSAEPPMSVDPTPADNDYHIPGYIVKEPLALGGSCLVCSGIESRSGALVAIKRVTKHGGNVAALEQEIAILGELRKRGEKRFLCTLVDTVSRRSSDAPPNLIDDMYMVYTPLAPESLATVIQSDCSLETRSQLFTELLQAIDYIHSIGLMHRDIKPANMAVVSRNPPHAMLIDFGHATWKSNSRNHYSGTFGYLAPELLNLKNTGKGPPYDNKVDLWAFGLCGYQLFCYKKFWWPSDNSKITKIVAELVEAVEKDSEIDEVLEVNIRMLSIDPKERISASVALEKPCFHHKHYDLEPDTPRTADLKRSRDD
ncbi:hypothetical protein MMC10_008270 [Thelotrema lepadinum]|nr:hypothetical protein [Thelotrema lepadinum]